MTAYVRPAIAERVFRDASGTVLDYGTRWGQDSPPDDTYSVTSNLERFLPLHTVADALIGHLVATYDVEVLDDPAAAADILHERTDVVRAVRLTPSDPHAAPLTFVFTSFPSVIVHAGRLHDFLFPVCGCDACDESWGAVAEDMEWEVLAVAAGGYGEALYGDGDPGVGFVLESEDGRRRSGGRSSDATPAHPEEARAAKRRSGALPDRWAPWPPRIAPG